MYDPVANEISRIIQGTSIDGGLYIIYGAVAFLTLLAVGYIMCSSDFWGTKKRRAVHALIYTLCMCAVSYLFSGMAERFVSRDSTAIARLAREGRLIAEPARTFHGNLIAGQIILREQRVEPLFGSQVETSGWSKSLDIEIARKLSAYLEQAKHGAIV